MQLQKLMDFVNQLEAQHLYYSMSSVRSDAIMLEVAKPGTGMRYEVEFLPTARCWSKSFNRTALSLGMRRWHACWRSCA
ncbi:MAG: hypothetical protein HC853_06285 [Anaerolineae bacterium]|nr:hypothetical protein [Anaerolineae bacterium]